MSSLRHANQKNSGRDMRSINKTAKYVLVSLAVVSISAVSPPIAEAAPPLICPNPQTAIGSSYCPSPHPYANIEQPGFCWVGESSLSAGPTYATAGEALDDEMKVQEALLGQSPLCTVVVPDPTCHSWVHVPSYFEGCGWVEYRPPTEISIVGEYMGLPFQSFPYADRYLQLKAEPLPCNSAGARCYQTERPAFLPCGGRTVRAFLVSDGGIRNPATRERYRCPTSYRVKLSRTDGLSESAATLTSIQPGDPAQLLARVYDQTNQLVPNVGIELKLEAVNQSGGHHHGDDTAVARTGTLASNDPGAIVTDNGKTLTGNTGTNGLQFRYNAPAVSGDIDINASCTGGRSCTQEGARRVWVGVKGLVPLSPSSDYVLVGETSTHPDNHYLTPVASYRLAVIANNYARLFPEYALLLHLNDASLERGGVFDIYDNWQSPHTEHCRGAAVDIRANDAPGAIPDTLRSVFEMFARRSGADPLWEIPEDGNRVPVWRLRHYHLRLLGREGLQCP